MRLAARLLTLQSFVCPVWPPLLFSSFSLSLSLSSTVRCAAAAGLPPFSSLFALCFSAYSFSFFDFSFHISSGIPRLSRSPPPIFIPTALVTLFFNPIPTSDHLPPYISTTPLSLSLSKPPSLPPFLHLRQLVSACSLSSSTILFSLLLLLLDLRLHQSVPSIDFFRT